MNVLLKNFACALLMVISMISVASAAETTSINVAGKNAIVVAFDDIQSKKAYARLVDEQGTKLWSTIIRNESQFRKRINLRNLPNGIYSIILRDGDLTFTQKVEKKFGAIRVIQKSKVMAFTPVAELSNRFFTVNYPKSNIKLTSVVFKDTFGNEFFKDELQYGGDLKRVYNLSELRPGEYTVLMQTEKDIYYRVITIK